MDRLARIWARLWLWHDDDFRGCGRRCIFLHNLRHGVVMVNSITRLEAENNYGAYIRSNRNLYMRINWWFVKPEVFYFLKIGETSRDPLIRCNEDSGNCVAIGSMNPDVTESIILDFVRDNYNETNFGMGTSWYWNKDWYAGPAGKTESFGNWKNNADAWEAAEHLIKKFDFTIIEASTVRTY